MTTVKTARQKGKDLENHIAEQIRRKGLDPKASRSVGSGSGNSEKADISCNVVVNGRNIGIEAKNHKVPHIKDWWKQTQQLEKVGYLPVLVYSLHNEGLDGAKAVVYLDDLLDIIKKAQEPALKEPDREMKWLLKSLIETAKKIIKRIE